MENMILQNEEQLKQYQEWENNEEIQIFREYLRFATVHPNIDYGETSTVFKRGDIHT